MEILEKLKLLKEDLKKLYGIEEIAIFSSVAREEETPNSDIDIVIIKIHTKEKLNRKVDIRSYDSLNLFLKEMIKDKKTKLSTFNVIFSRPKVELL
ncbi:Predicted nucleotidyltransferase [Desulfurobacterium pacificum]|uniref:Predicted nucleotidyltransferase n=1 Tax=Desulfurobacterium pacificum TaxID=240166 RepID=A0ABY1NRK8_9BACT|nr:nucleotidyltransferase domain-containing protein [Desulfurobacterium pacificum]SMP14286.1 Predicted nucleotidyltransferase [Desulfurobacterium pacificum]